MKRTTFLLLLFSSIFAQAQEFSVGLSASLRPFNETILETDQTRSSFMYSLGAGVSWQAPSPYEIGLSLSYGRQRLFSREIQPFLGATTVALRDDLTLWQLEAPILYSFSLSPSVSLATGIGLQMVYARSVNDLVVIKTDDQVQTNTSGHVELKDTKFTVSPRIQLAVKLAEELRFQFGVLYRFDRTELSSDDALSFSGQRQGGGGLVLFGFPIHNKYDFSGPNFSICFEYAL